MKRYTGNAADSMTNKLGIEILKLKPTSVMIDVGCGNGCALRHASTRVTNGTLIGVDSSARMIELAHEKTARHTAANKIEFYQGQAEKLPLGNAIADVALAFESIDHWQDPLKGLSEIFRVLKPHGYLALVRDSNLSSSPCDRASLQSLMTKAGFEVNLERDIQSGELNFSQWICAKKAIGANDNWSI